MQIYRQVQAFIFLQSASKGTKGKYYVKKNSFYGGDSVPSVNLPRGQWYIKTENGKYSVVDRESDDAFILNQEIFEVAEMEDTIYSMETL